MPELPEVETVRRSLERNAVGRTIRFVRVYREKLIKNFDPQLLVNKKIVSVDRYGKYLLINLDDNQVLMSHLRMEGKYAFVPQGYAKTKHDHVFFDLDDGTTMVYNDTRVFGTFHLYDKGELAETPQLRVLGPDPLQEAFTAARLLKAVAKKTIAIKSAILDQSIASGIGNIYADEVLWACRINPLMPANALTKRQAAMFVKHARLILDKAVSMNGTTIRTYHTSAGRGDFVDHLQAHARAGKPCSRCGHKIVKIKVNGRGTYYCPRCQKN